MCAVEAEAPSFTPDLFAFLRELAVNNDREWFAANKTRYVADVQEPALAFIEDVGVRLPEVSGHFVADARTVGGSLFRIYRDTRFSKDKTPYKTQVGIQFRHERAKDAHAPGFYLHLEPGSVFMACGTWHPDGDTLRAIRTAIAADADRWRAIVADEAFAARFRLGGETLKRAPAGFNPGSPADRGHQAEGLHRDHGPQRERCDLERLPFEVPGTLRRVGRVHAVPL